MRGYLASALDELKGNQPGIGRLARDPEVQALGCTRMPTVRQTGNGKDRGGGGRLRKQWEIKSIISDSNRPLCTNTFKSYRGIIEVSGRGVIHKASRHRKLHGNCCLLH